MEGAEPAASPSDQRFRPGDGMRVSAMLLIVIAHAAAPVFHGWETQARGAWWIGNVIIAYSKWTVPVFLMLSGALLLDERRREEAAWRFYGKRARRLAAPFIFWTAFYLWWRAAAGEELTLGSAAASIGTKGAYFHLYFLYVVGGLYLATPLLRRITASLRTKGLIWLTAGLFVLGSLQELAFALIGRRYDFAPFLFVPFLGYFLAGHVLRPIPWDRAMALFAGVVTALMVAIMAFGNDFLIFDLGVTDRPRFVSSLISPFVIVMTLGMWVVLAWTFGERGEDAVEGRQHERGRRRGRANRWMAALAPTTLGTYLMHPAVQDLWQSRIGEVGGVAGALPIGEAWAAAIDVLLVGVATFTLCTIATLAMMRIPGVRRVVS